MSAQKMSATEFCKHVENSLGWQPPDIKPSWKQYQGEAAKLKRKIATNPELYTWDHLLLAVEWLRHKRKTVTPTGCCWFVETAVAAANEPPAVLDVLNARIFDAITEAMVAGEPDWVEKLARSQGEARAEVLAEWKTYQEPVKPGPHG